MRPHRSPRRAAPTDQAGLTLPELIAVMVLTLALSAGLYAMTAGQSRTYSSQLSDLNTRQTAAAAMEYLSRQLRLAGFGFGGCPGGQLRVWDPGGGPRATSQAPLQAFRGFDDCALDGSTYPPRSCRGQGVDSFAIAYSTAAIQGSLSSVRLTKELPDASAELRTAACGDIRKGDLLALWEPGSSKPCTIIQATRAPRDCRPAEPDCFREKKACRIPHRPGQAFNPPPGVDIFPPGGYQRGALLINLGRSAQPLKFAIDRSRPVPRLVQWRENRAEAQVIAEGIEDMQLSWACDLNGNGRLEEGETDEERRSDEWAHNARTGRDQLSCTLPPGCDPEADPRRCRLLPIVAVRVTLIARSASVEPGNRSGFRPAAENRPGASPAEDLAASGGAGSFRRSLLTSVIPLRNRP